MNVTLNDYDVRVADHGVDVMLFKRDGHRTLVLNPHQSFNAAVRAVASVAPDATTGDAVRAFVREHLPLAVDLDDMLPSTRPVYEFEVPDSFRRGLLRFALLVCAVWILAIWGFALLHTSSNTALHEYEQYQRTHAGHSHMSQTDGDATRGVSVSVR